jgi:hypothetical protein
MKSEVIITGCYGITVDLTGDGGGSITSDLHEEANLEKFKEDTEELACEINACNVYNAAMDGIEALILSHAQAGIDITTPEYLEGIESAVQGCANNMD